jgi:Zn finger protein HypA/HybF involved in hydrogenase expression
MHDFHLADQIVKIAKEYAVKNNLSQINKIMIELGDIIEHGENISPENLEFNIKLLLPEVAVSIKKIKGDTWKLVSIEGNPF